MRPFKLGCICVMILMLCCGCSEEKGTQKKIQLHIIQDIITTPNGVIYNAKEDVIMRTFSGEEYSIFQDPFYVKDTEEEIYLQYCQDNFLYYIRMIGNQYYELCEMNMSSYENKVLYSNCTEAERSNQYLELREEAHLMHDETIDAMKELVRWFYRVGNDIYIFKDDTLYRVNIWTKCKEKIIDKLDDDTDAVFMNGKIYVKNQESFLVECDTQTGENKILSDWMVDTICAGGEGLVIQRKNMALYSFDGKRLTPIEGITSHMLQANDKFIFCTENNGSKLIAYDAKTYEKKAEKDATNVWSVASEEYDGKIYYLDIDGEIEQVKCLEY